MSWNNTLYTNVGTNMMSEVLSGATMTITKAVGGSGTTAAESLAALTDVKEQKQTLKILGIEDATDSSGNDAGKRIKIQITNGDVETGYILHQVGIYAKLADGEETLLIIMQDDRGVEIPSHTENSDFEIELYGIMAISNVANIEVTVDPNAVASVKMVNDTKKALQDEAQRTYLPLTGGTVAGPIIMPGGGEVVSIMDNAATHNMVYRGKALGRDILATCERLARGEGRGRLYCEVHTKCLPVLQFFKTKGYRVLGPAEAEAAGIPMQLTTLEKML